MVVQAVREGGPVDVRRCRHGLFLLVKAALARVGRGHLATLGECARLRGEVQAGAGGVPADHRRHGARVASDGARVRGTEALLGEQAGSGSSSSSSSAARNSASRLRRVVLRRGRRRTEARVDGRTEHAVARLTLPEQVPAQALAELGCEHRAACRARRLRRCDRARRLEALALVASERGRPGSSQTSRHC